MVPYASESPHNELSPIRTGTMVDKLSGIGGIPRKRITEIFGDAGLGKSSICLQAVTTAQAAGLRCLWADIEFAYDARYAEALGVDNTRLGLIQERFAEDALDQIEREIDAGNWDIVFLDSIGGLLPRSAAEKAAGEKTIGGQASLVATFCRKIVPILALRNTALVVINHSFTDIMSNAIKTSGGKKLEYHKSLSIRLKQKPNVRLEQGGRKIGKVVIGQVMKNKVASTEGMEVEGKIIFGDGFSKSEDLLEEAVTAGVLVKRGNLFYFGEEKIGMISKVREALRGDDFSEKIRAAIP